MEQRTWNKEQRTKNIERVKQIDILARLYKSA